MNINLNLKIPKSLPACIDMNYLTEAKNVINNEIVGIREVASKLDNTFNELIHVISSSKGRVVMCGMGKSGHIAKKIFATLVSTGTPSMFMHPAEAFHGDLGMIQADDIFFAISNSGETSEVTKLLPFIKNNGNTLIAMTGNKESTLGLLADYHIDIGVTKEACPLNLAPTTSTTASLVVGDAVAIALMKASGFKAENFAQYHPGGSLGRKILASVKDELIEAIFVKVDDDLVTIFKAMSNSANGIVLVGDSDKLEGVITDGDIRKVLSQIDASEIPRIIARGIMTSSPSCVQSICKCSDADLLMEKKGINSLVVKELNQVLGIYNNLNRKLK